ncbi:hypothetical protein [Amycolatopsis jiangsuensis]|uniref:Uncharacterized protein n=1 Tax=Amycolatopsis jiangsuensis TaxID=1181879 RepID=A0A840IQ54_9PSEU|nr:hypothetical protein [Amycolatopsis jiangsuensis]MBB4683164.1 hypothetical protein [Amycolatopsis jiangsuensis]
MNDVIWIHKSRARHAWYGLDERQRAEFAETWHAADRRGAGAGAELIGRYSVRGQSDFSTVEVWSFASVEDVFAFWENRVSAGYTRWFAFENLFGTR